MMAQITISLPFEDKQQFAMIAQKNDLSMSQLIRWFIRSVIHDDSYGFSIRLEK